jgi:hypothetical protein
MKVSLPNGAGAESQIPHTPLSFFIANHHPQDSGLERRALRRCCTAKALVLPIAQAMADLVCLEDFSMVKRGDGNHSSLLFLDRTQPPRRGLIECRFQLVRMTDNKSQMTNPRFWPAVTPNE